MAKQVTVLCDLDGSPGAETHKLVLDETVLMIDLSEASLAKLQKALTPFMKAGTVTVKANGSGADAELAAIRDWANANGHPVAVKGRIPQNVVDAYNQAHPEPTPAPAEPASK